MYSTFSNTVYPCYTFNGKDPGMKYKVINWVNNIAKIIHLQKFYIALLKITN